MLLHQDRLEMSVTRLFLQLVAQNTPFLSPEPACRAFLGTGLGRKVTLDSMSADRATADDNTVAVTAPKQHLTLHLTCEPEPTKLPTYLLTLFILLFVATFQDEQLSLRGHLSRLLGICTSNHLRPQACVWQALVQQTHPWAEGKS